MVLNCLYDMVMQLPSPTSVSHEGALQGNHFHTFSLDLVFLCHFQNCIDNCLHFFLLFLATFLFLATVIPFGLPLCLVDVIVLFDKEHFVVPKFCGLKVLLLTFFWV